MPLLKLLTAFLIWPEVKLMGEATFSSSGRTIGAPVGCFDSISLLASSDIWSIPLEIRALEAREN